MATSRAAIDALLSRKKVTLEELQQLAPEDAPVIMDIFLHDETPWNERKRRTALDALGIIGDERAVELLIGVAKNAGVDMWLREAAVRVLGTVDHPKAFRYLKKMAQAPDFGFRKSAVTALAASKDRGARQVLEQIQATDPDERIRQRAEELLATLEPMGTRGMVAKQRPSTYLE